MFVADVARCCCSAHADDTPTTDAPPTTDECAGLTPECINDDTVGSRAGSSACAPRPLADCAAASPPKFLENGADGAASSDWAASADGGGGGNKKAFYRKEKPGQISDDDFFLLNLAKAPPAPSTAPSDWKWYEATPKPGEPGTRVPATFLATSHEWDRMTDYTNNVAAFKEIFKEFGPSPILRIGGASQDFLQTMPPQQLWDALKKMHHEFGAKYIIGLPLWRADSADLAKKIMQTAEGQLPGGALVGFELGNEPEFWLSGVGGYDPKQGNKFVPGFDAYNQHFHRSAMQINPCKDGKAKLAGPGWGNVNTIDAKWFQQHVNMPDAKCYLRELTVHVRLLFLV